MYELEVGIFSELPTYTKVFRFSFPFFFFFFFDKV